MEVGSNLWQQFVTRFPCLLKPISPVASEGSECGSSIVMPRELYIEPHFGGMTMISDVRPMLQHESDYIRRICAEERHATDEELAELEESRRQWEEVENLQDRINLFNYEDHKVFVVLDNGEVHRPIGCKLDRWVMATCGWRRISHVVYREDDALRGILSNDTSKLTIWIMPWANEPTEQPEE